MLKVSKLGAKNMKNIYLNKPNLKLSLNVNQLQANKHNSHGENK